MPSPAVPPIPADQLPDDLKPLYQTGIERTGDAKWILTFDMVNREEICPIRPPLAA
jgi:hypothetical protein